MTPEQREHLRRSILDVLDANGSRYGLSVKALQSLLLIYGTRPTADTIHIELNYLRDKQMAEPVDKKISPEVSAWRITADGRDWLAMN